MLGLLDTTPAVTSLKPVKRRASGATGGRSGLKLSRQTSKPSEPGAKKSPRTPLQSSAGGKPKRLHRNLCAETPAGQLSADTDELAQNQDRADRSRHNSVEEQEAQTIAAAVTSPPPSSEKTGTQRITRRSSDLKLAESDSVPSEPAHSKDTSEAIAEVDSGMATD